MKGLNSRQHRFCLNILSGMPPQEAYAKAGYNCSPESLRVRPYSIVLAEPNVKTFIEEKRRLKEQIILANDINTTIASPQERKMILTELLRAQLVDFLDGDGDPKLSKDVPNHRAAREYEVSPTRYGTRKRLKLVDPLSAIQELNKMDGSYAPSKHLVGHKVQFEVIHRSVEKDNTVEDTENV